MNALLVRDIYADDPNDFLRVLPKGTLVTIEGDSAWWYGAVDATTTEGVPLHLYPGQYEMWL